MSRFNEIMRGLQEALAYVNGDPSVRATVHKMSSEPDTITSEEVEGSTAQFDSASGGCLSRPDIASFRSHHKGLLQKDKKLQQPLFHDRIYRQSHEATETDEHKPRPCAGCFRLAPVFCF